MKENQFFSPKIFIPEFFMKGTLLYDFDCAC